ncbi:PREDICTED: uncharacterized protein LOC109336978 [Lupinus angustifolius]|uniref:uncharacterized protein LOC109336978 n=1 Tax=Lupinus angustifolius TaxID=3871 RepID=UPI00092FB956|nr:PREDICTED: uncharacterized protein LOC109336978 [Lupinus angustifolius]
MEVYMDDMIAKSLPDEDHISILENIFQQLRKYNMRLNPEKCTFGVEASKFLGFLLTSRGIEANPSKCQGIIDMRSPRTVKEVQQLNGRLAVLSRFLPSAAKHSLHLFQLLKKSKSRIRIDPRDGRRTKSCPFYKQSPARPIIEVPEAGKGGLCIIDNHAKSQVLTDFVAELTAPEGDRERVWTIFVNGSSNPRGSGAGILLEDGQGVTIKHSLTFTFPTSNNQAEYEACIAGVQLAKEVGGHKRFTAPLLKFLGPERADYVLREIHEGSCGHHLGTASLAKKVLRVGYYWPTVEKDVVDLTRKCTRCQLFADFHKAPLDELTTTQAPWPFYIWGMDILGPFPQATGQLKFLIVIIDYFTKWIEAEALATITLANIQKFTWRNIITRFGIPSAIVTDNGTQFADRRFQ